MLLKDLITYLQELYFTESKLSSSEPEIVIHAYRQVDSLGNYEYSGTSRNINIETQGRNKPLVISYNDDFDSTLSPIPDDMQEEDPKMTFKYQIELLSDFPRVQANISSLWGTARGRECICGLLIDDRPGRDNSKVKGFPPEVYVTINNLLLIHDKIFPKLIPPTSPWDVKI